jgi:hypothetical protein
LKLTAVIALIVRDCGYTYLSLLKGLPRDVHIAYDKGEDEEENLPEL